MFTGRRRGVEALIVRVMLLLQSCQSVLGEYDPFHSTSMQCQQQSRLNVRQVSCIFAYLHILISVIERNATNLTNVKVQVSLEVICMHVSSTVHT